jgi:hypothetical protein
MRRKLLLLDAKPASRRTCEKTLVLCKGGTAYCKTLVPKAFLSDLDSSTRKLKTLVQYAQSRIWTATSEEQLGETRTILFKFLVATPQESCQVMSIFSCMKVLL